MPISPTNFDKAFKMLGVEDYKTSHQCSWENYKVFNDLLLQVKYLLVEKGIEDVTLLNAHSFVWIISKMNDEKVIKKFNNDQVPYKQLEKKDRESVIKARNGQGLFRRLILRYWLKSSVTDCGCQSVLIASHIKPWAKCNTVEAIDQYNGLLLTPNLDKLFDQGLISFNDNGTIIISSRINNDDLSILGINNKMSLRYIETHHLKYLEYHRKNIFNM